MSSFQANEASQALASLSLAALETAPMPKVYPAYTGKSDKASIAELREMLTYCRPAGSITEEVFIARYLEPLGAEPDQFGNYVLRIGTAPILWSSHTDTVHRNPGFQKVEFDEGYLCLPKGSLSNCLGADCTSGVWIMMEMVRAGVEGLYIWHRAEECGGIGSGEIADKTPELLDGIQAAVAFDRYGASSIITRQAGGTCCSQAFVESLSEKLPGQGRYQADDGGTFTDTASYIHLIPECTNISVGYYNQHCKSEDQDVNHLLNLRDAMVAFTYEGLVIQRDPSEANDPWSKWDEKYSWADDASLQGNKVRYATFQCVNDTDIGDDDKADMLADFVREYPEEVADLLREEGFDLPALLTRFQLYNQA